MTRTSWIGACAAAVVAATLVVAVCVFSGCSDDESAAESGFTLAVAPDGAWSGPRLPEFELLERSGAPVKLADLAGRPFVLDFIFTTCTGPCPAMSTNMRALQDELGASQARLVTITVDPSRDTPEVLASYAESFGADRERWLFLTGEEATIEKIAAAIALPMQRAPAGEAMLGMQVAHATRFVVVDGEGLVRGMYPGETNAGVAPAAARVRWLEAHPGK